MKVSIIPEKCIACGLCQTYSSRFDYHDDGIVKFAHSDELVQTIDDNDQETLKAVKTCPTKALTLL
ncbi:ferredoxin [Streptococcus halichoeri]|uniref:ferredoxin n=1 Tax=Streptococcus halichoeri TaxID=254785 RepID=UPI000DB72A7F|nr:ferredoxin [Streptococcus halichoeri]PZO94870.1 MAG: ferredoxin [Streptococcus pyogenes]